MSKYDWEEGTIKIPLAYWTPVKTSVILAWNREQDEMFNTASEAHKAALKAGFRKRGFSRAGWVRSNHLEVASLITREGSDKVYMPKKKDLKHLPLRKGGVLSLGDAQIHLDNKTRTVVWTVDENNHACERAHNHPVALALFAALRRVHYWTKGSGGAIIGNDEYNRDNRGFDGGANYTVMEFGPKKKEPISDGSYLSQRKRSSLGAW